MVEEYKGSEGIITPGSKRDIYFYDANMFVILENTQPCHFKIKNQTIIIENTTNDGIFKIYDNLQVDVKVEYTE